ncbi:MAG: protoporphyrinogen oxidase, partial [Planctomycetia bacterium 21-64-5]
RQGQAPKIARTCRKAGLTGQATDRVMEALSWYERQMEANEFSGAAVARGYRNFLVQPAGCGGHYFFTGTTQHRPVITGGQVRYRKVARYFTPTEIIQQMVRLAAPKPDERVIDMTCGGGGFLAECVDYIAQKEGEPQARRFLKQRLVGIDDDPFCVSCSRELLTFMYPDCADDIHVYLHNCLYRRAPAESEVHEDLEAERHLADGRYDLVIGNPPGNDKYSGSNSDEVHRQWEDRFGHSGGLMDHHCFVRRAVELARRVGLGDRLHGTNPRVRGSYILSGTRLRRMPDGLTGLVPSRFAPFAITPLVSPLGKLRVGLEYFLPPRSDDADESIERFVVRRLGREMYERLVEPLLSGISAGDGAKLSMEAMFPQLRAYEREHGGLVRGMLAAKKAQRGRAGAAPGPLAFGFLSLPGGLGELVAGIEREVRRREPTGTRVVIRTGARVERVERAAASGDAPEYVITLANGERLTVDAVILATPAYLSAALLRSVDEELSATLRGIEYASTVT